MIGLCPNDLSKVEIQNDGFGQCKQCGAVLTLRVVSVRFGCAHDPRPREGSYQWGERKIPYQFCSAECQAQVEATYPQGIRDMGLI